MKLFVGNLSFRTTEDTLRETFGRYGEVVDAKIITDRETGKSRGFGFVTMNSRAAGDGAIAGLDRTEVDGRSIGVEEAKEREGRGGATHAGGGSRRW